ncbi:hypothetical protein ACRS6Y_00335 [Bacillus cytotoxicus]|uniref:Group-specific protein n=1 Tax=Bacillus cytotoxicus (strain DSM 22905 / CIP 110041 / 391-98 / NVH 391-98) TaxID=315749 RepID=A7GNW9_BACCN|nr:MULTISPECIES: hypothetical protein [Bacillus cereus group]ABS21827.1 conserved hypothetical protein [Bacillus cytotoxicus NVH 391-98]KMT50940.1 hypothetical protein TU51_08135 [Bacillus cytotoxicus]MDH2861333.1 hypothetical protein [Bacillus cytotoxicus]MDH2863189.1 hypothetical protein [Bacillus cytotoxicus]MDH2869024.1 hypothetical protein [Bacillus cytotoxicus]
MPKKKIEDFLTDSEKEELIENYKCLREARTKREANHFGEVVNHLLNKAKKRIIEDAGIPDENAATIQTKRKALF